MILVRQRREAHAGLLEVERALLRFGAGEGWGADRLRAARLARRRPFPAAVLHRLGRAETGGKRERGAGGDQDPGLQESRDRHGVKLPTKRSEEHTSELQSLMRISYAVFCLKKKQILHGHNI